MIITCKKEVPFRWIFFAVLPWISYAFNSQTMSVAFLFSLKKFVENPAGLTFIISLPGFVSLFIVPLVNFISDRVWTPYGRRKPFVLGAWIGSATALALMPLMPNFWGLLAVYIVYNIFNDVGGNQGPMEPLCQEIVPPHQRGRSTGTNQWLGNLTTMVFFFFALGRFDDVRYMAGVPLSGEKVIYWSAGLIVAAVFLAVSLGIKETDQKSRLRGERLNFKNFFGGVFDRELWPVFLLVFSTVMLNSSLGSLGNLLYTDQWNYTKQEMGVNVVIGGIINMFIIVFLAMAADKLNRMRAYQVLICAALFVKAAYFGYINYILPDHRPSLVELVVFGETLSIIGMLTGMVYTPLVYDYVTRNKMGTYMAGAGILGRITYLTTLNGIGLFVWGYALIFQPPAGEMARVVLRDETPQSEVSSLVRSAAWTDPKTGGPVAASDVHVKSWMANGVDLPMGRCWEVRLRDKASEQLAAEKERLNNESSVAASEEKALRERLASPKAGSLSAMEHARLEADAKKSRVAEAVARIQAIDEDLARRAQNLQTQARTVFGNRILADGDQLLGAKMGEALLVEFATTARPHGGRLEKILTDLRQERGDIIDLRPVKLDNGYGLAVSLIAEPQMDEKRLVGDLQAAVERIAAKRDPRLMKPGVPPPAVRRQPTLALDLMVVEEPLDRRVSPIMRIANGVLRLFDSAPLPDRRLSAVARNLRVPEETDHVRVYPGPGDAKSISVLAVIKPGAAKAGSLDDAVGRRLKDLLARQDPATVAQARALYDRVETVGAGKQITVARPFVKAAYAPMKYDYMAGYICMFTLGLVGLCLTFQFQKLERKGLIRKRGWEEAESL
ncbi:MAG: MFS transporter [Chthoniobacteraceae bacterium]|nr:MFS transporter [Chthoniobacteraceae bacterium]